MPSYHSGKAGQVSLDFMSGYCLFRLLHKHKKRCFGTAKCLLPDRGKIQLTGGSLVLTFLRYKQRECYI